VITLLPLPLLCSQVLINGHPTDPEWQVDAKWSLEHLAHKAVRTHFDFV
jgi:hypothetical protein